MSGWTKDDILRLDAVYAKQGVHMHQRPFRAATELLGSTFTMGVGGNPEVQRIMAAYAELVPEVESTWPGAGIGLAVSVDQVRKLTFAVVFGQQAVQPWRVTGFKSANEWWNWCRQDHNIASEASFACADLHDLASGLDELDGGSTDALTLWRMARSNLEDVANTLPTTFSVDSVIQPICLVAELAMKAALVWDGVDLKSFKGKDGHNLAKLVERMATARPHRDDPLAAQVIGKLPPYADSRYSPAGLIRLEVVRLALAVQFVLASSVRRIANADLALEMESGGWPAPRRPFFPV